MRRFSICVLLFTLHSFFCTLHSQAQGIITTVAGNGTAAFSGDGGPATNER